MKTGLNKAPLWIILACAAALAGLLIAQPGQDSAASGTEQRIAEVLQTIRGAGRVEVALYFLETETDAFSQAKSAAPTGAVVVAEGAEEMAVRLDLIRAMRTLLGLPENAVDVFVMGEDE